MKYYRSTVKLTIFLSILAFVMSCASQTSFDTPSGKPEVFIPNISKDQVITKLAEAGIESGAEIHSLTEYQLILSAEGSVAQNLFFGSTFNPNTRDVIQFGFIERDQGVRVIGSRFIVSNPGSGFERRLDATTGNLGKQVQMLLDGLRDSFARGN